jgi:hypothetical protein
VTLVAHHGNIKYLVCLSSICHIFKKKTFVLGCFFFVFFVSTKMHSIHYFKILTTCIIITSDVNKMHVKRVVKAFTVSQSDQANNSFNYYY